MMLRCTGCPQVELTKLRGLDLPGFYEKKKTILYKIFVEKLALPRSYIDSYIDFHLRNR